MKKNKILTRILHVPIFESEICLVHTEWDNFLIEANKVLPKHKFIPLEKAVKKHGYDSSCLATQFPFDGGGSIIWANPKVTEGTLLHEIVHAVHHLMEKRATPLSEDTEETYAYLTEFVFIQLLKKTEKPFIFPNSQVKIKKK